MAWLLGDITLERPQHLSTKVIETSAENDALDGTIYRDIISRRNEYNLIYENVTQAEYEAIEAEFNDKEVKRFWVDDGIKQIGPVNVHIYLNNIEEAPGYTKTFTLRLVEEDSS